MSCINSSAPIDINIDKIAGRCDYKCNYSFQYNNSACIGTNNGDYISLSYDNTSSPPVIYNDTGYNVKEVRIYSPSIHTYNGIQMDGELIIVHNSITGLNPLLVCIPIKMNDVASLDSSILSTIIKTMSNNAPNKDEKTNINMQNYNLNVFVPKKAFFSYTGNLLYQPCDGKINYIVFSPNQHYINISGDVLDLLIKIITSHKYTLSNNPSQLYFNQKGAKVYTNSDNIYIDCQPIEMGKDEMEEKIVVTNLNMQSFQFGDIMKNSFFQFLLSILFFVFIFYAFSWFFKFRNKLINGGNNNVVNGLFNNPNTR